MNAGQLRIMAERQKPVVPVQMYVNGKVVGRDELNAPKLELFIRALAMRRAEIPPPVSDKPSPEETLPAPHNPKWRVREERQPGEDFVLELRHPGHGWIRFAFAPEEAARLSAALTDPR